MDLTPGIIRAVLEELPLIALPVIFVETECVPTKDNLDEIDVTDLWNRYRECEWRKPISEAAFRTSIAHLGVHQFDNGEAVLFGWKYKGEPTTRKIDHTFPWAKLRKLPRASLTNLVDLAKYLQLQPRDLDAFRKADPLIRDATEIALGRK